jgi:hypothetical protein
MDVAMEHTQSEPSTKDWGEESELPQTSASAPIQMFEFKLVDVSKEWHTE